MQGRTFGVGAPTAPLAAWAAIARVSAPFAAALVPFGCYLLTMPRTLYNNDSAEFATAADTIGVPHPPGYPLYVLLGHLFTWLPIGDVGYRVNLMSAVFASVTLVLVWAIVRDLTGSSFGGVVAAWLLGFAYPFWSDAIVAEVYTLDSALVAAMILCLLGWRRRHDPRQLAVAFLFLGLSLANRTTNLLNLPVVVLFLIPDLRSAWRTVLRCAPALLPGPALYGLLPLRTAMGADYTWGATYAIDGSRIDIDLTDPGRMWWFVSARIFRSGTSWYSWDERLRQCIDFAGDAWSATLGGGLILALTGLIWLAAKDRRAAVLLGGIGIAQTAFFINYAAIDKDTMFVHTYMVLAVSAGCAAALSMAALRRAPLRGGAAALLLALPLLMAATQWPRLDLSHETRARTRSEAIMSAAEPHALIIGGWPDIAPLDYLQTVEDQRTDLSLVLTWPISPAHLREIVIYNLRQGRHVYAMRRDLTFWNVEFEDLVWQPQHDWYELRLPVQLQEGDN